jgi:hypothetical protein
MTFVFSCTTTSGNYDVKGDITAFFLNAILLFEIFLVLQCWSSVTGIPDFNGMSAVWVEGFFSLV